MYFDTSVVARELWTRFTSCVQNLSDFSALHGGPGDAQGRGGLWNRDTGNQSVVKGGSSDGQLLRYPFFYCDTKGAKDLCSPASRLRC